MPRNIVDLSAHSRIIRDEPWHLQFWESTTAEISDFLRDPRGALAQSSGSSFPMTADSSR